MVSKPGGNQFNNRGHIMEVRYGMMQTIKDRRRKEVKLWHRQADKHRPSLEDENDI